MSEHAKDEKAIFLAALEKDSPGERAAYVQGACADDPELRNRVEELLNAHQGSVGPLDSPPPGLGTTQYLPPLVERAGTMIGPYKLLQPIGEGGMGTVWMAEQTEPLKRLVAVKLIKAGMDSKQVIARFAAERQALALMDHANIARVLDAGTTDAGRPYFVMDLVKGVPITKYCDEHHLTPRQRLELFIPVCQAVQHAHQKGIIHRDIKPSNVLVALYDGKPVPKVIDFGVAKATGQQLTDKTLVTGIGNIVGTLEYMSPEQAEVNQLDIDTRSDIYSLGVLLYELLTGSPPFTKKDLEKAGMLEMLRVIREEEPSKPSTKLSTAEGLPTLAANRGTEPGKLTKLVRGELDWIVMKALEKDRNRRYETANGFAMDVQRYLADEAVLACPPSVGYRVRKFARRNKVALTMAALVTALLFVAVAVLAVANYEINDALADKSKANDELGLAKQETEKANTGLKTTLAALTREQQETKLALDKERLTLYYHRIALAHREWSANNVGRADHLLDECPKELRHWEWHYMKRLCNAELFTLRGHDTQINCMAYSPDGRWIASGDLQGIRIWDAARGSNLRTLPHKSAVSALAFSPDSKRMAFTDSQGNITVCDLGPGGEVIGERTIAAFTGLASCVAFSPDGSRLAAGGNESAAKVFNVQTGQEVLALPLDRPACRSVEFSSDGRFILTAAHQSTIKVWDAATGQVKHGDWRQVYSVSKAVAFSPDSNFLATGQEDVVSVWNLNSGKLSLRLTGHTSPVIQLAYSPDGRHLASADRDGRLVRIWDLTAKEKLVVTLRGHADTIYALSYSPDGRRLASAGLDKVVKVWHTRHAPEGLHLRTEDAGRISYSAKAERVASIQRDTILVWDTLTGRELARLKTEVARSSSRMPVALSPDGRHVVSAGEDETTLRLWDVETQQELRVVGSHAKVRALTFSPDGARLASGAFGGSILLWDAVTGEKLFTLAGHSRSVTQLAYSPDGRCLASASLDGSAKLWEAGTGQVLHTLGGHGRPVRAVAFSSDGKSLLSGGDDGTVKQWDVRTGQELHTFDGHGNGVYGVALSPDGSRLAAALQDGSVVLWDTVNKREAITLQPGAATSLSVAYSRDGLRLLTSNLAIKIFNAAPWTDKASPALDAENLIDWTYWRDLAKNRGIVKRWNEAVTYYSKAIDLKPDDAFCWNARGVAHRRLGEKEKALADHTKASDLQPKEALYWCNRASLYAELGQHDKAIADYSVAIKLKPDDAIPWNERGIVYGRLKENEKALADYVKASELKPTESLYWYSRGSAYAQLGQHDKAVIDFSKAIDLKPNDAQWWHVRGMSYVRLGQKDKALADYTKASELKPMESQYWRDRAYMHSQLNQHAKAVADYSMAIKLKPDDAYAWNARGVSHSRLNEKEKALADYIKASDLKPNEPLYWYNRGSVYAQMGQHDKAVADYSKAIDLKPEDTYLRHMRGIAHGRLGQWNEALADHAKAAAIKPTDPRYSSSQGFACAQLGQWEKAAGTFQHATTLKPHYPLAWYYLALTELHRDDRAGYRKVCSGMLERFGQSTDADTTYWVAWTCILIPDAVPDWTKPLKLAEKAHADDGKNFDKINQLGALLYRAGRYKEAAQRLTEADSAFKPTPGTRTTIVYNWLFQAMTHHRLGRPADAALWLEKAVRAIDEPAPESAQDPATNLWNRRLTLQVLRREAEALLGKTSK